MSSIFDFESSTPFGYKTTTELPPLVSTKTLARNGEHDESSNFEKAKLILIIFGSNSQRPLPETIAVPGRPGQAKDAGKPFAVKSPFAKIPKVTRYGGGEGDA